MRVFISGGCKNGKSSYAQRIASAMRLKNNALYYIATMAPSDTEDEERIVRHRQEREGMGFETLEIAENIKNSVYLNDKNGSYLLDSVTALLANEMFSGGRINENSHIKVRDDLLWLLDNLHSIVVVSDYIYSDAFIYDKWTEYYRMGLACIDCAAARKADVVLEACCGSIIIHKSTKEFMDLYDTVI